MSVTALVPVIGYQESAAIARESWRTGRTIREIASAKHLVPESFLNSVLDVWRMASKGGARDRNVVVDETRSGNTRLQRPFSISRTLDRWRDDGGHE